MIVFLVFISIKTQAQIKINAYSSKVKSLSEAQKEALDFIFFGPVSKVDFMGSDEPAFLWSEQGPVKAVKLAYDQLDELKDGRFATAFKTAEVISVFWKKGQALALNESYLTQFKNIRYLLISGYDDYNEAVLKDLLKDLINNAGTSNQLEVIYFKMERPS